MGTPPAPTHDAVLEFEYDSPSRARIVADSVAREVGEIDDGRSRTEIDRERETVTVEVGARDAVALRAALNTWFSLIEVAERTTEIASPAGERPEDDRSDHRSGSP